MLCVILVIIKCTTYAHLDQFTLTPSKLYLRQVVRERENFKNSRKSKSKPDYKTKVNYYNSEFIWELNMYKWKLFNRKPGPGLRLLRGREQTISSAPRM